MLNLADISNPQYGALTAKKRNVSAASLLLGQVPAYRQRVQSNKENAFEEKKLAEDTRQADVSLALTRDIADKNEALSAEQMEISKDQAAKSNLIQGTGLALTGAYLADKAGIISLPEIAAPIKLGYKSIAEPIKSAVGSAYDKVLGESAVQPVEQVTGQIAETTLPEIATTGEVPGTIAATTTSDVLSGTVESTLPGIASERVVQTGLEEGVGNIATEQLGLNAGENLGLEGSRQIAELGAEGVAETGVSLGTGVVAAGAGIVTNLATDAIMQSLGIGGKDDQRRVSAAAGGAVSGAIIGAQIGSVGGPLGAAAGAGAGLVISEIFCFVAGTPVLMADGSTTPVEDLQIGDAIYAGGDVLGVGVILAGNICRYKGVGVEGGHAVFEDGRWLRVKNSTHAAPVPVAGAVRVYPVVTANHLICVNGVIFADLCETDQGTSVSDDDRLACLNSMTMRNQMLEDLEHEISEIR